MNKRNIYKIAKNLCLDKKDIDSIMSKDVSKTGTYYVDTSSEYVYKAGTCYGSVSIKDI